MAASLYLLVALLVTLAFSQQEDPFAGNCGGNCPGNDCDSCPCGSTPSPQEITTVCAQFSGWDQTCCQCMGSRLSGSNANYANETSEGKFNVGLFLIHSNQWPGCSGNAPPCAVAANVQCAVDQWKTGAGTFKLFPECGKCGCCTNSPTHATTTHVTSTHAASTHSATSGTPSVSTHSSSTSSYSGGVGTEEVVGSMGGKGKVPEVNVVYNK